MKLKNIQICILCIFIALFFIIHAPRIVSVYKLEKEIAENEIKMKNVYDMDSENKKFLKTEKPRIVEQIALLNKKIPLKEYRIELLKQLADTASSSGVAKIFFKEKEGTFGIDDMRKRLHPGTTAAGIEISPIELQIKSTYYGLALFLKNIKNISRLITVENVIIVMDERILPKLNITINANSYYSPLPETFKEREE